MEFNDAVATLGELLGRKKKAASKRPRTPLKARLAKAVKSVKTKAKIRALVKRKPSAKKPLMKAAWGRLTPKRKRPLWPRPSGRTPA